MKREAVSKTPVFLFSPFPRREKAPASRKGMRIAGWIHSDFFVVPQRKKREAAGAATVCL